MCNNRWNLKSPSNCMQHGTCWRSWFRGWWAREPSSLLLQPPVPLQQVTGARGGCRGLWPGLVCHVWAVSRLAACLPWLPLLKARCCQTLQDEGFQGGARKSWECRYMVLPRAGLHLLFLAALCIQNWGIGWSLPELTWVGGAELWAVTVLLPLPHLQPPHLTPCDAGVHTHSVWNL